MFFMIERIIFLIGKIKHILSYCFLLSQYRKKNELNVIQNILITSKKSFFKLKKHFISRQNFYNSKKFL